VSTFVNDTFTDTAATALASHTGETGATWTKRTAYSTGAAVISSANRLRQANSNGNVTEYYASGSPASPDYDVQIDILVQSNKAGLAGVMCRVDTSVDTCYIAWYDGGVIGTNVWRLYKYVAGTSTLLGAASAVLTVGNTYTLKLSVVGTSLTVLVNGSAVITTTDGAITAAGKAGIVLFDAAAGDSVGYHIDNFSASDAVAGPALAAGTLTATAIRYTGGVFAVATNTGGTSPYSNQLQRSAAGAGTWSNVGSPVVGATATLTDTTASQNTSYDYRVVVTDSAGTPATANTNTLSSQLTKTLIVANDSNLRYYGRWNPGSTAITINNGSELEAAYTGNTCNLLFDVSGITAYPVVTTWIDNAGPTRSTLDSTARVTVTPAYNTAPSGSPSFAAPVRSSRHRLRVMANCDAGNGGANNWTSLQGAFKLVGIEVDGGAVSLALPASPDQIEFLGDSITAGVRVLFATGASDTPAVNSPEINWTEYVAQLLGLKAVVNGHGQQGITTTGADGAPVANTAFPLVYSGVSWNPSTKPAVVVIYQGTNDGSITQAAYQTFLGTIRTAYPSAYIFAVVPHNKTGLTTNISAAVTAMADSRIFYLNYSSGVISTTVDQCDSIGHLNPGGCVTLAAKLASDIRTQLNTSGVKVQPTGGSGGALVVSGF
jgi:lysophospholipase L1-like esterase